MLFRSDQALELVRTLGEREPIAVVNSINPFRIEGQKTIMAEMLDQRDWKVPDWVVLPGGNLGNISAFGKGLRELKELGLIDRLPRLAVVQAAGSAPFYDLMHAADRSRLNAIEHPETLATAIKIGDPVSWPKALHELKVSDGVVEKVTEQEIADAKAVIGRCGIGCEPASAATLAGIRKLTSAGVMRQDSDVVAVLTGNVLKDPNYIHEYHTGVLLSPSGELITPTYGNPPVVLPNDSEKNRQLSWLMAMEYPHLRGSEYPQKRFSLSLSFPLLNTESSGTYVLCSRTKNSRLPLPYLPIVRSWSTCTRGARSSIALSNLSRTTTDFERFVRTRASYRRPDGMVWV